MITLRELSRRLSLSITTISRALDGYDDVSPATRERVRQAAAAAGYRPNAAARRLRRGRGETIALVLPTAPGRFHEPVFSELLAVIGEDLSTREADLILLAAQPGPNETALYRRLVADGRADAFILVRTRRDDERAAFLREAGVPFVCHGRIETQAPYAYVDGDGEGGFAALTNRLIGLGHRAIAHLGAPEAYSFAELRAAGWRAAMREADLDARREMRCEATETAGQLAAAALLSSADRPTALVCATDRIAFGAVAAARAAGLEIGRDVAIAGHDDLPMSAFADPPLTSMRPDTQALGRSLVAKLMALLGGGAPEGEVFEVNQIPRVSSGETARQAPI
jgi:LacI family transcriptional regulator